eukprot:2895614-Pyramimonas_sp.AAC.3
MASAAACAPPWVWWWCGALGHTVDGRRCEVTVCSNTADDRATDILDTRDWKMWITDTLVATVRAAPWR